MLCFAFFGNEQMKVSLCEEVLRYSPYKQDGVYIGAHLVVSAGAARDRYLYAIHRRALDGLRLATRSEWDGEVLSFPYFHVFTHLMKNRLATAGGTLTLSLPEPDTHAALKPVQILADDGDGAFTVEDFLHLPPGAEHNAPYTCVRIGPFPEGEMSYLFRIECHIGGTSFTDLIPEDMATGTRLYKVYGPDYVIRHIEALDIPQAVKLPNGKDYEGHMRLFAELQPQKLILPAIYSIVAVDNPNCRPMRLQSLNLTSDLRDVSDNINPDVYKHRDLARIQGRLHWFLCDSHSQSFFLQLVGPMALAEVTPVGA